MALRPPLIFTDRSGRWSCKSLRICRRNSDLRFRIYKKLKFNIRYAYSLAKIRTRTFEDFQGQTWTRDQFNNLITFRLVYMINEKLPARASSRNGCGRS